MIHIESSHFGDLYQRAVATVIRDGVAASPRGVNTIETLGAHLVLTHARNNVAVSAARALNFAFMAAEWVWMVSGFNWADLIQPYNKGLAPSLDEGSDRYMGAYGPKIVEQLPYVVDCLKRDRNSRQAVITLWRERPRASKDIPCTVSLQYVIRQKKLHAFTHMRSNDIWLGLPYDVFNFTQLQKMVAWHVDAVPGDYHHFVNSLHVYEHDLERAREFADDEGAYTLQTDSLIDASKLGYATAAMVDFRACPEEQRKAAAQSIVAKCTSQLGVEDGDWRAAIELMGKRFDSSITLTSDAWSSALREGGRV